MSHLRRNIWLSVSGVALVLIVLILLSAFTAWVTSAEIRNRHNRYPRQNDNFPDNAQSVVLQLNSLLLVLEIHPELRDSVQARFYELAGDLDDEFTTQENSIQSTSARNALFQITVDFKEYLEAARLYLEMPGNTLLLGERLGGLHVVYQKAEHLLLSLERLGVARNEHLAAILGDYGFAHQRLVWLVFVLASLSSILVGGFSVIYLLNRVGRLRLEMSQLKLARQKQEKLASLGILATGVAHEIRNPLTAIKARLFALERKITPHSEASEQTREIGNEINRLENIVKEVLLFARPAKPVTSDFELGPLLEAVGGLMKNELDPRKIQLKVSPPLDLRAKGDQEQIKQILINLIHNAADVSKPEDTITLATRRLIAGSNDVAASKVAIDVIDQGPGISSADAKKIFSPFFTTKPQGTGLGLSISKKLAKIQKGDLKFKTQIDQGSTFTLILPIAE